MAQHCLLLLIALEARTCGFLYMHLYWVPWGMLLRFLVCTWYKKINRKFRSRFEYRKKNSGELTADVFILALYHLPGTGIKKTPAVTSRSTLDLIGRYSALQVA